MTPLQFEQHYRPEWDELQELLRRSQSRDYSLRRKRDPIPGERLATLYRRACEQLALARARSYPAYLTERLERLTADGHQLIYQHSELGLSALKRLVARDFPQAVRRHAAYIWVALGVFALPLVVLGCGIYLRPDLILTLVSPFTAQGFEEMYSDSAESIGRLRDAQSDWVMFGYYIGNNIGIAFQCFAGGLFCGIGSLYFLAFNGAYIGGIAGYLTQRGLGPTFYSFVVTHGAFELTAIVLSGAAGLRIGHALLAPGQRTRRQALVIAAKEATVLVYGMTAMLLIAAAIEAFWSSARWIPLPMKYSIAACCWIAVLAYLTLQGRRAR